MSGQRKGYAVVAMECPKEVWNGDLSFSIGVSSKVCRCDALSLFKSCRLPLCMCEGESRPLGLSNRGGLLFIAVLLFPESLRTQTQQLGPAGSQRSWEVLASFFWLHRILKNHQNHFSRGKQCRISLVHAGSQKEKRHIFWHFGKETFDAQNSSIGSDSNPTPPDIYPCEVGKPRW